MSQNDTAFSTRLEYSGFPHALSARQMLFLNLLYLAIFGIVEYVVIYFSATIGVIAYIIIILTLIYQSASIGNRNQRKYWIALGIIPLIRIISLATPIFFADFPNILVHRHIHSHIYWHIYLYTLFPLQPCGYWINLEQRYHPASNNIKWSGLRIFRFSDIEACSFNQVSFTSDDNGAFFNIVNLHRDRRRISFSGIVAKSFHNCNFLWMDYYCCILCGAAN